MTVEQVAATAGVAKATVYRRWASKAELVFELVLHGNALQPPGDTGTLEGDLLALTRHVITLLTAPPARQAIPGLLADLRADPLLAERFQRTFIDAERQLVRRLLTRAVERGELTSTTDPVDVHAQLLGTVFAWVHLAADRPPAGLADRITRALLATIHQSAYAY
jgi:AcrR family transcriptional regulator